jgi:hypothetical protein
MLNMNLLGSWVDGEATLDAVPFCHALVRVAVATNNRNVRQFIVDDMLPSTIKRLYDGLPCAVQQTIGMLSSELDLSKSKKASEDLLVLCEEIYKVFIQSQVFCYLSLTRIVLRTVPNNYLVSHTLLACALSTLNCSR